MLLDGDYGALGAATDLTSDQTAPESLLLPDRDRRFQRRCFRMSELHRYLVDEIRDRFADSRPHVILCCGKCRVGSTPLANVFGHAGLPSFYQPMKTLLRHKLVSETCPWWSLESDAPVVFLKETFGPYVAAECAFQPLDVLLDAGFPAHDVTLVVMERDPMAAIESWWRCWHDRINPKDLMKIFIQASFEVHQTAAMAAEHGIQVEYYLHEESRKPEAAMSRLFDALGIGSMFDVSHLRNWTKDDSARSKDAAISFFTQPKGYRIEDIHLELDEYRFVPRFPDVSNIPFQVGDLEQLDQLCRLYRHVCEKGRLNENEQIAL